ncbi:hypothetical protein [Microbispora sp. NPDC046933]|uniref:hypothetical protein n=1 Tax=Microbispora sp. NPDC046933 TaxID=3155618 RepID=UPI003405FEE0
MTLKIAVIHYSATGTAHALARAVAEGAASAGAGVRPRRVAEPPPGSATPRNPKWRRSADATRSIAQDSIEGLAWAGTFAGDRTARESTTATTSQTA